MLVRELVLDSPTTRAAKPSERSSEPDEHGRLPLLYPAAHCPPCPAPIDRTISRRLVLHTPVTSAPNALASWTAKLPTPPEAPMTTTCWPGWTPPVSRSAWRAANPEMGTAAASSELRLVGFRASWLSGTEADSAKDPSHQPKTAAPGGSWVTLRPTASTRPATSKPGTGCFGLGSP
jgi:hypothetical protein